MTNAEKFKQVFELYATELWAMPEKDFLVWLNADVPDKNVGDTISRQDAIDALDALCDRECEFSKKQRSVMCGACHLGSAFDAVEQLPSAQPSLKDAVKTIEEFLNNGGDFITGFRFKAKDGALLKTDWGYFEDGLYAIEEYAERRTDERSNQQTGGD